MRTSLLVLISLVVASFFPPAALAFPADFDGDGKVDLVIWRPSGAEQGYWYIQPSSGSCPWPSSSISPQGCRYQWGLQGDNPIIGDFDGDGKADYGVRRSSNNTWYILYSGGAGAVTINFCNGNNPAWIDTADINGDNISEMICYTHNYAENKGTVWVRYYTPQGIDVYPYSINYAYMNWTGTRLVSANYSSTSSNPEPTVVWLRKLPDNPPWTNQYDKKWVSFNTDISIPEPPQATLYSKRFDTDEEALPIAIKGDADNNGLDDFNWYQYPGNWTTRFNTDPSYSSTVSWGLPGDWPVRGDYDGDGAKDLMVFRPSNGTWYLKPSNGVSCPAIFCPTNNPCPVYFYGGCYKQWGLNGDIPMGEDGHYLW